MRPNLKWRKSTSTENGKDTSQYVGLHSDIFICRKNAFLENDSAGGSLVSTSVRICILGSLREHSPSFTSKFNRVALSLCLRGYEKLKSPFLASPFVLSPHVCISPLFCKSPLSFRDASLLPRGGRPEDVSAQPSPV